MRSHRASQASQTSAASPATPREAGWRAMFAGFHFLRNEPGVLALILIFSLTNGLNDVMVVLVPRLARFDLRLPATAFDLLASCMGAGALLGAFASGLIAPQLRRRAYVICGSLAVFGLAIAAMGLARDALALDAAYLVMDASFAIPEVVFGALLQRIIPAGMRGRVYSLIGLLAMAMNPPGLLLAGVLGDKLGPRAGLWIGGGAIVPLALLALLIPAIRALDTRVAPTEPIEAEALTIASLDS